MRGGTVRFFLRSSTSVANPESTTSSLGLLDQCRVSSNTSLAAAKRIYAQVMEKSKETDDFVAEEVVSMFIRCGSLTDAANSLDQLRVKSVVAWTATITAFARSGHYKQAFVYFYRMLLEGVSPNKVSFISIAGACSSRSEADFLHDRITEMNLAKDRLVGTALLKLYGKFESLDDAWRIFCELESKDLVSWNSMLSAFSEQQQWRRSLELFKEMLLQGLRLDSISFLAALKACANLRDLSETKLVHGQILERGLESADLVGNTIVDTYGKCRSVDDALSAFERIPSKDIVSWNVMLAALGQNESCAEAVRLFKRMLLEGERAEKVTLATLLHSFSSREFLREGELLHDHITELGLGIDIVMATALLIMYARCGSMDRASGMFDTIVNRDVVLWNTFISLLSQADRAKDSVQVFRRMQLEGVRPNKVTFATIVDVCTSLSSLTDGLLVASLVLESGLGSDTVLANAIVDLYGKCGSLENARKAFERIDCNKDVVSWTTILGAYSQHGLYTEVAGFFNKMLLEGIAPSKVTFVTVLYACAEWKALEIGKKIHACAVEAGLGSDELVSTAVRSVYAECGYLDEVCRGFHSRKQQQDVSAWNGMVIAFSRRELFDEAVAMFRQMQLEGVPGDKFTLVSVLEACSELSLVRSIEERAASLCLEQEETINTALVKAYSRCGSMSDARRSFERAPKKDVVSWSAMVAVHAHHGHGEAALEIFQFMQLNGVMPNEITFVSVFAACSHCGSVERAYEYFMGLEQDYGVEVTAEHWKCLMDLLGRAGRLGEAEMFLSKMEFEPDVVFWTTLLAACSVQGNFELGKHSAERILELDDEEDTSHVVLTSLHQSLQG